MQRTAPAVWRLGLKEKPAPRCGLVEEKQSDDPPLLMGKGMTDPSFGQSDVLGG